MRFIESAFIFAATSLQISETATPTQDCRDLCNRMVPGCNVLSDCLMSGVCSHLYWSGPDRSSVIQLLIPGLVPHGPQVTCGEATALVAGPSSSNGANESGDSLKRPHDDAMGAADGEDEDGRPLRGSNQRRRIETSEDGGAASSMMSQSWPTMPIATNAEPTTAAPVTAARRPRRVIPVVQATTPIPTTAAPRRARPVIPVGTPEPIASPVLETVPTGLPLVRSDAVAPQSAFGFRTPGLANLALPPLTGADATAQSFDGAGSPIASTQSYDPTNPDNFRTPPRQARATGGFFEPPPPPAGRSTGAARTNGPAAGGRSIIFSGPPQALAQAPWGPGNHLLNILSQYMSDGQLQTHVAASTSAHGVDGIENDSEWAGIMNGEEIRDIMRQVTLVLGQEIIPELLNFPFQSMPMSEMPATARVRELVEMLLAYMDPQAYAPEDGTAIQGLERARDIIGRRVFLITKWRRAVNVMMGALMNMGTSATSQQMDIARSHIVAIVSLRNILGGRVYMREIPNVWSTIIPGLSAHISEHAVTLPVATGAVQPTAVAPLSRTTRPRSLFVHDLSAEVPSGDEEEEEDDHDLLGGSSFAPPPQTVPTVASVPVAAADTTPDAAQFGADFQQAVRGRHLALSCPICNAFNSRRTRPVDVAQLGRLITAQFVLANDPRRRASGDWETKRGHITEHLSTFMNLLGRMINHNMQPEMVEQICAESIDQMFLFMSRYVLRHSEARLADSRNHLAIARRCMRHLSFESRERVVPRFLVSAVPNVDNSYHEDSGRQIEVSQNPTASLAMMESLNVLRTMDKLDLIGGDITVRYTGSRAVGNGPRTAWITRIMRRAFDPSSGLFVFSDERNAYMKPALLTSRNRDSHLVLYRQVGRLLGLALVNHVPIGVGITPAFAYYLANNGWGEQEIPDDILREWLFEENPELGVRLDDYERNPTSLFAFETSFSEDEDDDRIITPENVAEYFRYKRTHTPRDSITEQANSILRGIYDVLPFPQLALFNAAELGGIFRGPTEINVADLRRSTTYTFGSAIPSDSRNDQNEIIGWVWQALESFTPDELKKFLMFVSGTDVPPLHGFSGVEGTENWLQISLDPSQFGRSRPSSPETSSATTTTTTTMAPIDDSDDMDVMGYIEEQENSDDEEEGGSDMDDGSEVPIPTLASAAAGLPAGAPPAPPSPYNRNFLPRSQTCFKQLIIGFFDSYEILRARLLYAIEQGVSMENA